jgi:TolA-binding protein
MSTRKPKSFWSKPEGVTGAIFLLAIILGAGYLISTFLGGIIALASTTAGMLALLGALGVVIFMALDGRTRALISYMYKSAMRSVTSLFVRIDPISILKSYIDDLKKNLRKMNRQVSMLRGQMHKLREMILNNQKQIKENISLASEAKDQQNKKIVILKTRKAGRLRDSNLKLEDLYKRMEVMYRVLSKMGENSSILLEDVQDQVSLKEQERKAIRASHSAMNSAMSIIKGDADKRALFDQALEVIADDVSGKVGEMEQFMEMSEDFMNSIDLQNGIFEEKGLKMLEEWEAKSDSLLLGSAKGEIISLAENDSEILDLDAPMKTPEKMGRGNQYDDLFND